MFNKSSNRSKGDEGNTNLSSPNKKQDAPCKQWCFTLNNYEEKEYSFLISWLSSNSKYIVGKEIGEKGTPHLQGYFNLRKKMRFTALIKINDRWHLEKKSKHSTEEDNIQYCSKDNDYVSNMYIPRALNIIKFQDLYTWELEILQILKKPIDDRKIFWFWEPTGNIGKSTFTKYLCHYHNAVPVEGKKNDILYCCANFETDLYIFDFERSMEEYVSYGAIEKVKNGCFMCSKYESKPIIRNCPNIFVFANFEPDTSMLSKDRWVIKKLLDNRDDHTT